MSNISNFNNYWHQNISHKFFFVRLRGGLTFFHFMHTSTTFLKSKYFRKICIKALQQIFVFFPEDKKHICTKYFTCMTIGSIIYIHISEHSLMAGVTIDGRSYYELRYIVMLSILIYNILYIFKIPQKWSYKLLKEYKNLIWI